MGISTVTRKTSSRAHLVWPPGRARQAGGGASARATHQSMCECECVPEELFPPLLSDPTDSQTLEPSFVFFAVLNKRAMPRCVLPGFSQAAPRSHSHLDFDLHIITAVPETRRRVFGAHGAHDDASSAPTTTRLGVLLALRCPRRRATSAPTTTRQRCAHGVCSRRFVHERFTLRSHRRFVHERFAGSWLT